MKRRDRRSDCPTNYALQVVGDSWSLLVVRDLMFAGKRTYSEFAASEERISSNILAERLRSLAAQGIIRKDGVGRATRYSLTPKGLDLLPLMVEMIVWAAQHDRNTAAPASFLERAHNDREGLLAHLATELRVAHEI
jgi:DNA-binding HxlR family transcriptional regulator